MIIITQDIEVDLKKFENKLGYKCDLENPKSHNEKLMRKKFTDRNPLLQITADKIKVKDYVNEVLGDNNLFFQRIYEGYDLKEAEKHLTNNCVIKMNNASGRNIFITNENDKKNAIKKIIDSNWMNKSYGLNKGEWCYDGIKPGIVIEDIVFKDAHNNYRFMCFSGEPKFIHIDNYKIIDNKISKNYSSTYDINFNYINVKSNTLSNDDVAEKSIFFDYMFDCAKKLSNPFDFVRVDFVCDSNNIFFGELTHYPVSGKCKFTPISFDYEMGRMWK